MNGILKDRISPTAFRVMAWLLHVRDRIRPAAGALTDFGIQKGATIVDYGCGTGSYLPEASRLVGESGKIYAVDVHELAIKAAERKIQKHRCTNIVPMLAAQLPSAVPDHCADLIYAMDMFHMASNQSLLLREFHRICKQDGHLVLDRGHMRTSKADAIIDHSPYWTVVRRSRHLYFCNPQSTSGDITG